MKTIVFTAKTLEEAEKSKELWQSSHKGVIIKKEHPPIVSHLRSTDKKNAKTTRVRIKIEYEDSN
jgi:ribosomal protein L24